MHHWFRLYDLVVAHLGQGFLDLIGGGGVGTGWVHSHHPHSRAKQRSYSNASEV